jgi:hypothetical protein
MLENIYGIYQARERLLCRVENNISPLARVSLGDVTEIKSVHRGLGTSNR